MCSEIGNRKRKRERKRKEEINGESETEEFIAKEKERETLKKRKNNARITYRCYQLVTRLQKAPDLHTL